MPFLCHELYCHFFFVYVDPVSHLVQRMEAIILYNDYKCSCPPSESEVWQTMTCTSHVCVTKAFTIIRQSTINSPLQLVMLSLLMRHAERREDYRILLHWKCIRNPDNNYKHLTPVAITNVSLDASNVLRIIQKGAH